MIERMSLWKEGLGAKVIQKNSPVIGQIRSIFIVKESSKDQALLKRLTTNSL